VTERRIRSLLILSSCVGFLVVAGPLAPVSTATLAAQGNSAQGRGAADNAARVPGPGNWEWWNDADVQRQIGLTPEKVAKLDGHYRYRSKELAPVVNQWTKEWAELDAMTKAATVDESTYTLQVLTVEALRSKISESRMVMIYRMFRELSPDQYSRLQEIFSSRRNRGGNGRGPGQ
jgi:Spy/CpxP family protein refolding chaperone